MDRTIGYLAVILLVSSYLFSEINGSSCDDIKPCVPKSQANAQFEKCCDSKRLGTCAKHCRYDADLNELKKAIKSGDCELSQVRNFLRCASNNKNNNKCCEKTGVLDGAREICEPFCNPNSSDYPQSKKGIGKYLKCLKQFDQIMECHWASCR